MTTALALSILLLLAIPARGEMVSIHALGLKADLPDGASVGKHPLERSLKRPAVMIRGDGYAVSVIASRFPGVDAAYADAKADLERSNPTRVTADEKTGEGYVLAFENKGSAGPSYFVRSFKLLGGKGYDCRATGSEPRPAATALTICRSLVK